jgi:large subunit ribosomal protein L4
VKVDVVDTSNKKVADIDVDDSVFGARVKPWLFYEIVKAQMATRRAGTQSTKTISEISGTGKKPFKQKGTGRARQGSMRSAHMRGGATHLGPRPRSYEYSPPKKMVKGALRSALSLRLSEAKLHVVKGWSPSAPKTKDAIRVLSNFGGENALVVASRDQINLMKSVRNLRKAKFLPVEAINVYDILNHEHLFIADDVVAGLNDRLRTTLSRRDAASAEAAAKRAGE